MKPEDVKKESEKIILEKGGEVLDWLPVMERGGAARSNEELINRALILNALVNIYFQAPIHIIKDWIDAHNLTESLSESEKELLDKENEDLTEQEKTNIYWFIEALWALMWAGSLIDDLPIDNPVEDRMAKLCPNLEKGEGDSKFRGKMKVRPKDEIFKKLDLYFRAHWYTRNGLLNNYPTGKMDDGVILERRKALEWLIDSTLDWDDVPLNT
ncbi:MAG: DUF4272 domain-containing protein [Spirochaetes bacterium]|nr:DUF4272 domain-containing protein [Spirochaetota bacterium]